MKMKMISLLLMFFISSWIIPQKASAQVSVSFQVFYNELSPYGMWVDNPDYGYVWVPNAGSGFRPYASNGYWTYTDQGWAWVSNYQWGWAPFHYGRWYNDITYGPIWVPGYEWGPGWVSWRRSGTYYGWAPMGPGVTMGMAYGSGYYDTYNSYTFVPCGYMGRTTINNYYVNTSKNTTIINNTTVINNNRVDARNVTYSAGPDRVEVEKNTGKQFKPLAITESSKPGMSVSNGKLQTYRPEVQKNNSAGQKPAPTKVVALKDVKPAAQRTAQPSPQKINQPVKQQLSPPQRTGQPNDKKQMQPQRNAEQPRQQMQPQRQNPTPNRTDDKPQQRIPPTGKPMIEQQRKSEPPVQRQMEPQRVNPSQERRDVQPQQQPSRKPDFQQSSQPLRNSEPPHQQPQQSPPQQQPVQNNPPQNNGRQKQEMQQPSQKPNMQQAPQQHANPHLGGEQHPHK